MQKSLLCVLFVIGLSSGYNRFINLPDGDGNLHLVDLAAVVDIRLLNLFERNPAGNQYYLFTRRNPKTPQTLIINNVNSIINSNFNAKVGTVVIVHGWLGNKNTAINPTIRDAYLANIDVNIIVLDWSLLARSGYVTATKGVPIVGRCLGQFLKFLSKVTGQPFSQMHIIGFSLGAHVVGNAGRELGGIVARITGLDPAGPLWNNNPYCIKPSDAKYVEIIHTNAGVFGINKNVGDVDFYPNGGRTQPGCLTNICNHNRAWQLFAASVRTNIFIGNQCPSKTQLTLNNCHGAPLRMGNNDLRKTGRGIYLLGIDISLSI